MRFEWDEAKNRSNRRKHGVKFEEASQVFNDPLCISVQDCIKDGEQRWRTFGLVEGWLFLMVAHTFGEEHEDGMSVEIVRIISARHATRKERRRYEEEND